METYGIQPNSTQVPHLIIRDWMPRLKDVELRVLLVVTDQTLGWIEDKATGRRKEKDWISHYQLREKTGRADRSISRAVKALIEKYHLIEAYNEAGVPLESAQERQKEGFRIYYRLDLKCPPQTLFGDTYAKKTKVGKKNTKSVSTQPPPNWRTPKVRTTKETDSTKETNNLRPAKTPSAHKQFIDFWYEEVKRSRHIKPIITGRDGRNLKRILESGIAPAALEQLAVYFLNHWSFKEFAPSISTFLSAGVLNGIQNRMQNRAEFWKELDGFAAKVGLEAKREGLSEQLAKLRATFGAMPISYRERAAIGEEVALTERMART